MSYTTAYIGSFVNTESDIDNLDNQKQIDVYIYDTESAEADSPQDIIDLEMADNPVKLIDINNNEDKFEVFRSRRAEIRIHSSGSVNIDAFAEGGDNRWFVEIYYDSVIKFNGFLSISDMSQDFMPDPNVITLIATDGLGFLEAEDLTDFDGDTPQNENQIMDYLAWCFAKSGVQREIWCIFNIRERYATPLTSDDSGDGHFFKHEWLDAKTFEAGIGECENCRLVVEKILKKEAYVTTRNDVVLICRIDELQVNDSLYVYKFDYQGNYLSNTTINPVKELGVDELCGWMNDDCLKSLERSYKHVKLTANFEYPIELICNVNYQRGDESASQWLTDYTLYDLDCWTTSRNWGANEVAANTTAHIARKFNSFDVEEERFIVIKMPSSATNPQTYIKSSAVPISQYDKFTWSFDYSATEDNDDSDDFILGIGITVLYGDDGSVWTLEDGITEGDPPSWEESDEELSVFRNEHEWDLRPSEQDLTEWRQFTVDAPAVPVSGELRFYLYAANRVSSGADDFHIRFSNLSLTMRPYINGSYRSFSGQYYKVTHQTEPEKKKAIIEDVVNIADLPKKAMKGCLLKTDSPGFALTQGFYSAAVFPDGPPDETYVHPYSWLQIYDLWNQYYRTMRKFEGTVDRLDTGSDILDLVHKYKLNDASLSTNGKVFMALHIEQDLYDCETNIFLHEVHDENIDKEYPDNEFNYITDDNA